MAEESGRECGSGGMMKHLVEIINDVCEEKI